MPFELTRRAPAELRLFLVGDHPESAVDRQASVRACLCCMSRLSHGGIETVRAASGLVFQERNGKDGSFAAFAVWTATYHRPCENSKRHQTASMFGASASSNVSAGVEYLFMFPV